MKKQLTWEYIINGWLEKYHGITVKELIEKEPELCKTTDWFKKYAVTQQQHDKWYEWAITEISKNRNISKKQAKRNFCFDYLNVSPDIKVN